MNLLQSQIPIQTNQQLELEKAVAKAVKEYLPQTLETQLKEIVVPLVVEKLKDLDSKI